MKKQSFYFSLLILIVLVGFNSCTIEKRSYQPGYYVDWHNANRKSKTNAEIELKKGQETVCEDKIVVENNVEKIEDFIQPITIQELEPVYASNDVNVNNIEITNSTKQENAFTSNTKKEESKCYEFVRNEKSKKTPDITKEDTNKHWASIVGFSSGILAWLSIVGILLSDFTVLLFVPGSILFSIVGIIFSIIALRQISNNPEKYSGKQLASHGLFISAINLALWFFLILVILIL